MKAISMTQSYQARIYVTLRPSVLDPAGAAVRSGIEHLGFQNVASVRIGKYIEVSLDSADEQSAQAELNQICDQLLANPVIENYRFELVPAA
jgi:phosphoribosylformylglycinamidine synthase subunit PurS